MRNYIFNRLNGCGWSAQAATALRVLILCGTVGTSTAWGAFRYADAVTTSGGQFNDNYAVANLMNNGFVSPTNVIDTRVDYFAAGNNYASANGTTGNFNLTFEFNSPVDLTAMYVWNYVWRNGANGTASTNIGVNAFTLTFYAAASGTGTVLGGYTGTLARAKWDAINPAENIDFGATYAGVRSVVMRVLSNHGGGYAGMNELAFESSASPEPPLITSFTSFTNLVTYGSTATLNWVVSASVTNLFIDHGIGDVLPLTTNNMGSIVVSPTNGLITYALVANNTSTQSVTLVGLPSKDKVNIYLLIGQSNMQGIGQPYNANLDAPNPRILKYGSRDGMESELVAATHPLTSLGAGTGAIGMGLEFAKTLLASNAAPDEVIVLINHALGSTAIQWWAPGVIHNKRTNAVTGLNYYLYDEAITRATNAAQFGVIRAVLWHQGEYNANTNNTNPSAEPELYAERLDALVDNLRRDLDSPGLPLIVGKFVLPWTNASSTVFAPASLHRRDIVEAALDDLPNRRFNTACVDNTDLRGHENDVIHFNAFAQRELGRRYAGQLMDIMDSDQYPPRLNAAHTGTHLQVSWPANYAGWLLQSQTNLFMENWTTIGDSATTNVLPLPADPESGTTFFRLASP